MSTSTPRSCNRLQQTATDCNRLQQTATDCNRLQQTCNNVYLEYFPKSCNTLKHTATHKNTLKHTATHCNTLQHIATHCNTLQHTATMFTRDVFREAVWLWGGLFVWRWWLPIHCTCVSVCCRDLQWAVVCYCVLQCDAARCSESQCLVTCCRKVTGNGKNIHMYQHPFIFVHLSTYTLLQCVAACCSVLQCPAACCSV